MWFILFCKGCLKVTHDILRDTRDVEDIDGSKLKLLWWKSSRLLRVSRLLVYSLRRYVWSRSTSSGMYNKPENFNLLAAAYSKPSSTHCQLCAGSVGKDPSECKLCMAKAIRISHTTLYHARTAGKPERNNCESNRFTSIASMLILYRRRCECKRYGRYEPSPIFPSFSETVTTVR